jgi:uncharacterized protein (TIGR02594 family)
MMKVPAWLMVALNELGQKEISGDGNNPRILEYLATVGFKGGDEIPWCAAFVNWCLSQCGLKGTGLGNAKSYTGYGVSCEGYPVGSILIMNRGADPLKGHVAFCLQVNANGTLFVIGGNQGDRVSISCINQSSVVGVRLPKEL